MKIYLGSDHNGFLLKERVFAYLVKYGYDVEDVGGRELNPDDDFPQFAQKRDPSAICTPHALQAWGLGRFRTVDRTVLGESFEFGS